MYIYIYTLGLAFYGGPRMDIPFYREVFPIKCLANGPVDFSPEAMIVQNGLPQADPLPPDPQYSGTHVFWRCTRSL